MSQFWGFNGTYLTNFLYLKRGVDEIFVLFLPVMLTLSGEFLPILDLALGTFCAFLSLSEKEKKLLGQLHKTLAGLRDM